MVIMMAEKFSFNSKNKKKDKLERPKKGRPRNKFVTYKTYWCLPYGLFCDVARRCGKCSEESPEHSMPFPFSDFDCQRYVKVPNRIIVNLGVEKLTEILQMAFLSLMVKLGASTNVKILVSDVQEADNGKFYVKFNVKSNFHENLREREIEVVV